ncbi:MAG: cell division protein FtsK/SpoIIIE [Pseudonocardia sp.]|nr:cell division protein FtsK/SpoIIIE [Pseudonocardia sp.]
MLLVGSVAFVALGPREPSSLLLGGMFALSTIGMLLMGGAGRGAGQRTAALDEERRDYLRYLALLRRRVRAVAGEQRAALEHVHPEATAWPAVVAAGRLWERRPADPDFGHLRVGRGPQRLATRVVAPATGPVERLEPLTALALRRFLRRHAAVADLPVAVALRGTSTIWLEPEPGGGPGPPRALARALVAHYALWHSPGDARLVVVAAPGMAAEWEWVKWLPHAGHPQRVDRIGSLRMITGDADDVRDWWAAELAGRPPGSGSAVPHLLVVVDGAGGPGSWAAAAGATVARVGVPPGRRPGPSVVRLVVGPSRLGRADRAGVVHPLGGPDALTVAEAVALARRLARYRPIGVEAVGCGASPALAGLPALLGLPDARPGLQAIRTLRARRGDADLLRVPIGVDETGAPVSLDLKESARGGSGPHGLCVGATGSGKSELLRTLVVALAATHTSAELNLVLVDFKGGATFLGLAGLPHVSAVITDLADELALVDRMADALEGEITRRQELLRAAGNLAGIAEYTAACRAENTAACRAENTAACRAENTAARHEGRSGLPPLPALLVVVDEFSELLARRPEHADLMARIGRLGRSLGLHLLLASQRLDEGRLRGLESHLSYRIALRTFSAAESRAVLGVPDAHQLPPAPGSAFLATGTDELMRFRAAYVSGPAGGPRAPDPVRTRQAYPFRASPLPSEPAEHAAHARNDAVREPGATVLDNMITAMIGQGPPAHRVWLPPLAAPPPLDELLGEPHPLPGRGFAVAAGSDGWPGRLRVPVGLIDRPALQRREPLVLDLAGAEGHVAVVGGPRAGKSSGLQAVVLALALTHTPAELGVHVLDFGGGLMSVLAALPHVGTVADRHQPDLVGRTAAELAGALARRERLFRASRVGSMQEFRARRASGEFPDEPATDLLLVVDGYLVLRDEFDAVENRLLPLATQGLSYGVHLAVSANRWSELRPALKDLLGSRLELRLGEPGESEIDRRRAAEVPVRPGHGLEPAAGAPSVLAAPSVAVGSAAGGGTRSLVEVVAGAWHGPPFAPVALLPARVHADDLPTEGSQSGLGIGLDEEGLSRVELDPGMEPHLVCFADAESGKTTLLRVVARALVQRHAPDAARVVVVDYRRGLLGAVPASHLIGFASTARAAADAAQDVAASLRGRLPGTGVTARELRDRSWWRGPELYVLIDDYDLVADAGAANPLLPLVEFLPQAKDVGLHVVLARRCGGAGRALFDPLLGRLRELAVPGLVMNGSPDEGPLIGGVKPEPLPPGRAVLVDRRRGRRRVQLAWLPPETAADGGGP